jgi:hypothetical protein
MNEDRELLELAAKVSGVKLRWKLGHGQIKLPPATSFYIRGGLDVYWNPLTDDGDALRLAVRLGLTIGNEHESAGVSYCTRGDTEEFPAVQSGKPGDPPGVTAEDYAATRRAIVRAAAEIGKAMP